MYENLHNKRICISPLIFVHLLWRSQCLLCPNNMLFVNIAGAMQCFETIWLASADYMCAKMYDYLHPQNANTNKVTQKNNQNCPPKRPPKCTPKIRSKISAKISAKNSAKISAKILHAYLQQKINIHWGSGALKMSLKKPQKFWRIFWPDFGRIFGIHFGPSQKFSSCES